MDLNQLNCFIAVSQYLNFTEAAKSLYLSQSAISHNIAELEKELGAKLFSRTKNSVSLTPAGEMLLKDAFTVESVLRNTKTKIQMMTTGTLGELRVGYVFEYIAEAKLKNLRKFRVDHPDVNVVYNAFDSIKMSRKIAKKELDVGFARQETLHERNDINWEHLYSDPLYICVPETHHLAAHKSVTIDMVASEILLMMSRNTNPGMFDMVHHLYMLRGYPPIINDSANDLNTIIMMARIGYGMIILPGTFRQAVPHDMKCLLMDDEYAYHDIGVAWNKNNENPALKPFLETLFLEL